MTSRLLLACLAMATALPGRSLSAAHAAPGETNFLPRIALAERHFGNDAPWYRQNIPFFACSDPQIEQIYYYRWKLYRSHLKDLGDRGYIVTEFLDDVGWSLKPEESLNDATGFHINEGRWLRDRRYVNDYIDYMYHGGNDRHFSEAIARAAYDHYLVHGDRAVVLRHLDEMKRIYRQWDDHYDIAKGMYFIEPLLDATEYTISSMDASGGKDGFRGGDAFRPSINSFMYANALTISTLSAMAGDALGAREFASKAAALRERVEKDLWNEQAQHFLDRYKVSNTFVHYGDFIRGRELAGYTPWYFGLPGKDPRFVASWRHLLDPNRLGGAFGLRTVEPSYEYYQKQRRYVVEDGIRKPECQWNGPSWPFQTTLALGGMANLLNDYPRQEIIRADDYLRLLHQYAAQHYHNGQPDLQEDYDPDTGQVIVGLHRSHHYNHSGFNDLVITGLVGLRPRADTVLEVNPLVPSGPGAARSLTYFCLENVLYRGHLVTVLYDRDGTRYHRGAGLSVYVDGKQVVTPSPPGRKIIPLTGGVNAPAPEAPVPANLAVNLRRIGFPTPSASTGAPTAGLHQAIDGRVWFYPNVRNYWTNTGSQNKTDWYGLEFERPETLRSVRLAFFANGTTLKAPTHVAIQYWNGAAWATVTGARSVPARPVENGETVLTFAPVQTTRVRAVFTNPEKAALALVELQVFGTTPVVPRPRSTGRPQAGLPRELVGLQSENSHTGELSGVPWRDADKGGFFSFLLDTAPDAANALVVTYWGSDAGNRRFEIRIDGVRIAEQVLENNRPGEFFEVTYPIPRELTRGKAKVTVRFQAKPGAFAGGVFGARITRP